MKVLLVDDHELFRDGLHYVLKMLEDRVELFDADSLESALNIAKANSDIDLVLLDLHLPDSKGTSSVNIIHAAMPEVPIVVVSGSDLQNEVFDVIKSGARGFIPKMATAEEMILAIRFVLNGGTYLPPQLMTFVSANEENRKLNDCKLTARQIEILRLIAEGLSNKQIALKTNIGTGTIKIHLSTIFQLMRVNNRMEAVQAGYRMGILEPDQPIE